MNPISVTLNETQNALSRVVGDRRMAGAVARGYKNKAGLVSEGWDEHRLGAAGELAFSVGTGVPWPMTVDTFSAPDFPPDVDIKTRKEQPRAPTELMIRPGSNPDYRYVHVVLCDVEYQIRGWSWGYDVMQDEYLRDFKNERPVVFLLPNRLLRPLDELVRDGQIL